MDISETLRAAENVYADILHLTANENIMSPLATRAYTSPLACRYRMGNDDSSVFSSGNFAAKAMPEVWPIISQAEDAANRMLHSQTVNLNCLSGIHAMLCAILTTTKPGDTVMSVFSRHGGHFCTKGVLERTGRHHIYASYDFENLTFDVDGIAQTCQENNVSAIYLDTSVLLKPHPVAALRKALGDNVTIIYDASHTIGLIMGGIFQNPLDEGADVISANTHKTLPGPHHGLVAFKNYERGRLANQVMAGNLYSSTHINSVLALAVTILEMEKWGTEYANQVIANSNRLGLALTERGVQVRKISGHSFSATHQVHAFIDMTNVEAVSAFLKNRISINTSRALGENLFIRLGTQEITRRGIKGDEIDTIAQFIADTLNGKDIGNEVLDFVKKHESCAYCFT